MHSGPKIGELFPWFEHIVALKVAALTDIYLQFPWESFWIYDGPVCVLAGINNLSVRFLLYMDGSWAMASLTINAQRQFFKDIQRPFLGFGHAGVTAHAFDVDFSVKTRIELLITWGQIPDSFLGVEGEGRLEQMFSVCPEMAIGVLSAAYDVGDFFPTIVQGITTK